MSVGFWDPSVLFVAFENNNKQMSIMNPENPVSVLKSPYVAAREGELEKLGRTGRAKFAKCDIVQSKIFGPR